MILFNLADEGVQLLRRGCTVSSDGTVQFTPSLLFIQNGRGVQICPPYSDNGGAFFLLRFKYLHIGILDAHECELTLELADIGVVAVDQVAINVLLAGFAQVSVVFQQLDVLTFLASAVDSVGGVEILPSAVHAAIQIDIAVLYFSRKEIYKRFKTLVQAHVHPILFVLNSCDNFGDFALIVCSISHLKSRSIFSANLSTAAFNS